MKLVLLKDTNNDPIKRAAVIGDVIKAISLIPFEIQRSIYIKECSESFGIDEKVLLRELAKNIAQNRKKEFEKKQKDENDAFSTPDLEQANNGNDSNIVPFIEPQDNNINKTQLNNSKKLFKYEKDVMRYIIKYGMLDFCYDSTKINEENPPLISLLTYVSNELLIDNIKFSNKDYNNIYQICLSYRDEYFAEYCDFIANLDQEIIPYREEGMRKIQASFKNIDDAERQEKELEDSIHAKTIREIKEFQMHFLEKRLSSHLDDNVRRIALEMISEKHQLSKIHTKYGSVKSDDEQLYDLVPKALFNWKDAIIDCQIKDLQQELTTPNGTNNATDLMKKIKDLYDLRKVLAKQLGDRVVNPK